LIGVAGFGVCGFTPQSALISEICLFQHSETWQQKSFTPWLRSLALLRLLALLGGTSSPTSPSLRSSPSNSPLGRRQQLAHLAAVVVVVHPGHQDQYS
jgi:hypothetical protein